MKHINFHDDTVIFHEHSLDALPTANFPSMEDGSKLFQMIREWSPEFPLMVMEFWPGWFDHWGQPHKGLDIPGNPVDDPKEYTYTCNICWPKCTLFHFYSSLCMKIGRWAIRLRSSNEGHIS